MLSARVDDHSGAVPILKLLSFSQRIANAQRGLKIGTAINDCISLTFILLFPTGVFRVDEGAVVAADNLVNPMVLDRIFSLADGQKMLAK